MAKVERSHRGPGMSYRLNLFSIACNKIEGSFNYSRTHYDFYEGTLMFTAPHQVLSPGFEKKVEGWVHFIHPDFLHAGN